MGELDFEQIYQKGIGDMNQDEKLTAVLGCLYILNTQIKDINKHLCVLNGKTKEIPWMVWTLRVLWVIAPGFVAWLLWLTKCMVGI